MKTSYVEVPLDKVLHSFATQFTPPDGEMFIDFMPPTWFVDQAKGVVIFKLVTDQKD